VPRLGSCCTWRGLLPPKAWPSILSTRHTTPARAAPPETPALCPSRVTTAVPAALSREREDAVCPGHPRSLAGEAERPSMPACRPARGGPLARTSCRPHGVRLFSRRSLRLAEGLDFQYRILRYSFSLSSLCKSGVGASGSLLKVASRMSSGSGASDKDRALPAEVINIISGASGVVRPICCAGGWRVASAISDGSGVSGPDGGGCRCGCGSDVSWSATDSLLQMSTCTNVINARQKPSMPRAMNATWVHHTFFLTSFSSST